MPIIPSGYCQHTVVLTSTAFDGEAMFTCGNRLDIVASPDAVAEALGANYGLYLDNMLSQAVTIARIDVKFGPSETGPSGSFALDQAGTNGTQTSPANVAVLVRKATLLGGRRGRGRMYVPGVPDDDVDNGSTLTSTVLGEWQAGWDFIHGQMVADQIPPFLLHGDATTPTEIEAFQVDPRVATQRRRLRR